MIPGAGTRALEVEVRPPSPYRLPVRGAGDGVMRVRGGAVLRLLHVDGAPILVSAHQGAGAVRLRAQAGGGAEAEQLERGIERMRFALSVDDDLSDFYRRFKRDRLLGPVIRRKPWLRPRRRPWPWEALAWAITKQLIESGRAAAIQRRIVWRWGPVLGDGEPGALRDVPGPERIAGLAPAELQSCDLSAGRSLALIRAAREIASGRVDPGRADGDRRLAAIREIGPWTLQVLGLDGRGDPDSLPAGDLAYIKLVGRLAGLGRRATVEEVEEFFAPYEPYRGLAGTFAVVGLHKAIPAGPPLRNAA